MTDPKSLVSYDGTSSADLRKPRLRDLTPEDRPRERLLREGPRRLDHASLLSLLLGTGRNAHEDALMLARRLLSSFGSLQALSQAQADTLCSIRGIGPAKAARLIAMFEVLRRVSNGIDHEPPHQNVDLSASLSMLARERWDGEGSLVIACPTPRALSSTSIYGALDDAVTLSLEGDLSDATQYRHWLARLLVENPERSWCLISLRPLDELRSAEQTHLHHLIAGAHLLQLELDWIIVSSRDRHWTLLATPNDEQSHLHSSAMKLTSHVQPAHGTSSRSHEERR